MKKNSVYKGTKKIVGEAVLADTFFGRLIGLMPVKMLEDDKGIILKPCRQIHTFHMKYSIDVIFLSEKNIIIRIEKSLDANKITPYIRKAKSVLEVKGGTVEKYGLVLGDILKFKEAV